jgi:deoxyribonuclease IV
MAILGAHTSIAGGYYKAAQRAHRCGCACLQVFTHNSSQWRAKDITPSEAQRFRDSVAESGLTHPIAHGSYLINLASPDSTLWHKSVQAFVVELRRAEALGITHVVTHPGAYITGTEADGLRRVIDAMDEIHDQTRNVGVQCLLETTAGQGTSLGWRFEQLATVLDGVQEPQRLGVCFDTCHVFAAGYPLAAPRQYRATMDTFERLIGLHRIKAFHLNDSRREMGARVDRHEHIGQGKLGLAAFRNLLHDRRFRKIPMYLETPKGETDDLQLDMMNLATLRQLAATGPKGD